jgi:hypothetical protein
VEVDDGAFELAEGEGVVGAARQTALDRMDDRSIFLRPGVADEACVALGFRQGLGIAAAAVGQGVRSTASGSRITTLVCRDSTVISTLGNRW